MALRPTRAAKALADIVTPPPHLTQSAIARACGKKPQAVAHWLNFVAKPDEESRGIIEELTEGAIPKEWWDEPIDLADAAPTGTEG